MSITAEMRPVPGYDGFYATSDGEILYAKPGGSPQPVKTYTHRNYQYVLVNRCQSGLDHQQNVRVHTMVLLAFHGPRPTPRHECRHLDSDPQNNRASNLRWGTHRENLEDCVQRGTGIAQRTKGKQNGEANPHAKLTAADVAQIRQEIAAGMSCRAIGRAHGVTHGAIAGIRRGQNWKHLSRVAAMSDESEQHMNQTNTCVASNVKGNQDGMGTGSGCFSLDLTDASPTRKSIIASPYVKGGSKLMPL